jgi:hypothetical protein
MEGALCVGLLFMSENDRRMNREDRTLQVMINIYCQGRHDVSQGLCADCEELLNYARKRLRRCPYQSGKTTCAKCPTHCYRSAMREGIRAVMRYARPRVLLRHPVLALFHLMDSLRKKPSRSWPRHGKP